jgi:2-dehydropantoate 2-reductase
MRIAVLGSGGVGGYFGGRLAAAGADVSFIARGAHLDALRHDGLTIESPKGNAHVPKVNATSNPADIGPVDVVLFTVKLYDFEAATAMLPPLLGPDTAVVPCQNGVDAVAMLTRAIGPAHTAGGTCYVSALITAPGTIKHVAMDRLVFGEVDGRRSERLQALLAACEPAGFQAALSTDINVDIWAKFARLSVLSGLTAITRGPLGAICDDPALFALLKDAVRETYSVARAKGVNLPESTVDDVAVQFRGLPPQTKASMLEDLERGKRLELPWLSGAVSRIGREVGVPTPIHTFIATVLGPRVNGG